MYSDGDVEIALELDERDPVETATAYGRTFAWTAKQADVPARGTVRLDGRDVRAGRRAVVDVSAGYHPRHTVWKWSAGVGQADRRAQLRWNLVTGIHDSPEASERTIWLDGEPMEVEPVVFGDDLESIRFATGTNCAFASGPRGTDRTNRLVMRSYYRQPFGTFEGAISGGLTLAEGYGVMEDHEVWW